MRTLIFLVLLLIAGHADAQQAQGASSDNQGSWKSALPVQVIETPDQAKHGTDREQKSDIHDAADLDAQVRGADAAERAARAADRQVTAAWWQVVVGGVGIVALAITILLTVRSTNAAVSANDIAREQFASDQRPWLRIVDKPVISLYADPEHANIIFAQVGVKNTGRSPAVEVTAHVAMDKIPLMLTNAGTKKFAESVAVDNKWATDAVVVFPEDESPTQVSGFSEEIPEGENDIRLLVCVTYKASGMNQIYYTAIAVRFTAAAIEEAEAGTSMTQRISARVMERSLAMI